MTFFLVPGESLGKDNSGRVEPIPIAEVKTNRAGIGKGECEGAYQMSPTSTEVSISSFRWVWSVINQRESLSLSCIYRLEISTLFYFCAGPRYV